MKLSDYRRVCEPDPKLAIEGSGDLTGCVLIGAVESAETLNHFIRPNFPQPAHDRCYLAIVRV